jgi:hypothetical protein
MRMMILLLGVSVLFIGCSEPANYLGEVEHTDFLPSENCTQEDEAAIADLVNAAAQYGETAGKIYKVTGIDDKAMLIFIIRATAFTIKYYGLKDGQFIQFSECHRCDKFLAGDKLYCEPCQKIVEKERAEAKDKDDDDWFQPNPGKPWSPGNPIGW